MGKVWGGRRGSAPRASYLGRVMGKVWGRYGEGMG